MKLEDYLREKHQEIVARELLEVVAKLWCNDYANRPDAYTIWSIDGNGITVGDVRRARLALGLPTTRQE